MISDALMAQAAAELADAMNDTLPEPGACKHPFSPRFERKMRPLIRRANHPVLYRTLRIVASIVLAVIIGFESFLAVNVEAREFVFGWVKQQYQDFYQYFFIGEEDTTKETESSEAVSYQPGWMPEGSIFVTSYGITEGEVYIYTNEHEELIQFSYTLSTEIPGLFVSGTEYNIEEVLVNGVPGEIYSTATQGRTNGIVWKDEDDNTLFFISGNCTATELIKIAESIKKIK